jgi:hypothetical protein
MDLSCLVSDRWPKLPDSADGPDFTGQLLRDLTAA